MLSPRGKRRLLSLRRYCRPRFTRSAELVEDEFRMAFALAAAAYGVDARTTYDTSFPFEDSSFFGEVGIR
jgi:hypothetical protein